MFVFAGAATGLMSALNPLVIGVVLKLEASKTAEIDSRATERATCSVPARVELFCCSFIELFGLNQFSYRFRDIWLAQDCRNLSTDSRSPESTVKRQETKDAWPFCLLYLSISVHLNVCEITERPVVFADQPEIITQPPIITVVGKAFFDIGHAPAGHSNRRTDLRATPDSSGDETRCSSWEAKSRHVEKA